MGIIKAVGRQFVKATGWYYRSDLSLSIRADANFEINSYRVLNLLKNNQDTYLTEDSISKHLFIPLRTVTECKTYLNELGYPVWGNNNGGTFYCEDFKDERVLKAAANLKASTLGKVYKYNLIRAILESDKPIPPIPSDILKEIQEYQDI